ncbi:MAG: hypothetical protein FWE54_05430 [Methanimicrococcus sp.]|nr:hypothetical protein [Methanimicrococcus sp.]
MAMMLLQGLVIAIGSNYTGDEFVPFVDMILIIVCNLILIVSVYFSVLIISVMRYDKVYNFYTSKRFRTERKVAILIGMGWFILVLALVIQIVYKSIVGSIQPLDIDDIYFFGFFFGLVPLATLFTFFIVYKFVFMLGLRKPYYNDDLDQ